MRSPRLAAFLVLLLQLILVTIVGGHLAGGQRQSSKQPTADSSQTFTLGQKRAISRSKKLPENTVGIFDENGTLVKQQKVDPSQWGTLMDYAATICTGPEPISSKCVRCENGEIICTSLPTP